MAKLGDGSLSGLQKLRTLYHQGPNGAIDTAVKFMQAEVYHEGMRLLIGREGKSTGFTGVDEDGNTYANPSKYGPENTVAPSEGGGIYDNSGNKRESNPGTNPGSRMPGVDDSTNTYTQASLQGLVEPGGAQGQTTDVMTGQSNILSQEAVPGFVPLQSQGGNTFGEGQLGPTNFVYQFDDGTMRVVQSVVDTTGVVGNTENQYYPGGAQSYTPNTNTPGYFGATKNIIKAMPTAAGPSIAGELGTGDLVFNTLYNHDQTSKFDDRLKIQTPSGYRGQEPYIVHDIPVGSGAFGDYGGLEGGRLTNKTVLGRLIPGMRALTDAIRIGKFIFTMQGLQFEATQFALQFMNPRNQKIYNPLSMVSSIPIGVNMKIRLARGEMLNPNTRTYPQTILDRPESAAGSKFGKNAREWESKDSIIGLANKAGMRFGTYFVGGNAMQVAGKNKKGETDITNVAPAPTSPLIPGAFMSFFSPEYSAKEFRTKQWKVQDPFGDGEGNIRSPRSIPYKSLGLAKLKRNVDESAEGTIQTDLSADAEREVLKMGEYSDIPNPQSAGGLSLAGLGGVAGQKYKEKNASANVNESLNAQTVGNKMSAPGIGDAMSLIQINQPKEGDIKLEDVHPNDAEKIESVEHGMPFYFKDLRDNSYIFFRAFLEGINEAVTPTWSEEKYIGRSEPVHIFEGGTTRAISYSLKLFARSKDEYKIMWEKINKMTSLCYPEYKDDALFESSGVPRKTRMKAPFCKMRMGELYGSKNNEAFGFIESITYNVPDEAVWETAKDRRAPKYITLDITFRHLHQSVPDNKTEFYGYVGK